MNINGPGQKLSRKKISQELLDINSFLGYNKERISSRMEVRSMANTTDIEHLRFTPEGQRFDRKSAKIDAKALAIHIIAFANADGGTLVIGIEDNGNITGIDVYEKISMSCSVHRSIIVSLPSL